MNACAVILYLLYVSAYQLKLYLRYAHIQAKHKHLQNCTDIILNPDSCLIRIKK